MSYLTLNSYTVPVKDKSARIERHEVGDRGFALDGSRYSEIQFSGSAYQVETTQLTAQQARALLALVSGDGHRWDFEDSGASNAWKYASSGAGGSASITSASRGTSNPQFGSANLDMSTGGSVDWALGLGSRWTAMCWVDTGGGYQHLIETSDGRVFLDGIYYTPYQVGRFDGTDDSVSYGDVSDTDGVSSATFSAWVYQTATDSGTILQRHDGSTGSFRFEIAGSSFRLLIYNGISNWEQATGTPLAGLNTWYHLAAVYTSSTVTLYVDGAAVASTTNGTIPATLPTPGGAAPLLLGATNLAADISNVAFWAGTAASAGQVAEIYNAGRAAADYATLATLGAPTWWAPLNGSWAPTLGSGTAVPAGGAGFATDTGSGGWFAVSNGTFTLQNDSGGDVDFDDLVVLPVDIPTDMAQAFGARTTAWPDPPQLELGGDVIGGVTTTVEAPDKPQAAGVQYRDDSGSWVGNGQVVQFSLVEVP